MYRIKSNSMGNYDNYNNINKTCLLTLVRVLQADGGIAAFWERVTIHQHRHGVHHQCDITLFQEVCNGENTPSVIFVRLGIKRML
jgi:hypothetical protein